MGKRKNYMNNYKFIDSAILNEATYNDYLNRFTRICLSMFEWVNLPLTMDSEFLEKCLFEYGTAALLKDTDYGFINTQVCSNGKLNIYRKPSSLHCYSLEYQTNRKLYTGINLTDNEYSEAILVQNNWDMLPTLPSMELFAWRLYNADRSADVNINAQKFPMFILLDEKQRLTMENLFNQYQGNRPVIFGDKSNLDENQIKAVNTEAPFVADKLIEYKKEIWNEALTFLGINNIMVDKKERLVADEANSNNELINFNLQSFFAPRQKACKQFNDKFGFTGTDKEISVRVRSDLHNVIKNEESVITDYKTNEEVENNGNIYNRT